VVFLSYEDKRTGELLVVYEPEDILKLAEALSSLTRLNILALVSEEPRSISELGEALLMTKGNVSSQVSALEAAGLVETFYLAGRKGVKKLVKAKYSTVMIKLQPQRK